MPNAEAVAVVEAAIADYNAEMPAARRAVYLNYATKLLPFGLAVAAFFWLVVFGMTGASSNIRGILLAGGGIGAWYFGDMLWKHVHEPVTGLRQYTRDRLVPKMFGFVDAIAYANGREPRFMARLPAKSVVQYTRVEYDDSVRGTYGGTDFELCEMRFFHKAGKSEAQTFEGIVFQFPLAAPFSGEMVIIRRRGKWDKFLWGTPADRHLSEIASGDRWTDDNYEVKTDNRHAGLPLARANLPQLLRWLETTWHDGAPTIALKGADGFLFLPSKKNFFELPSADVALEYRAHAEPMVRELITLIATANLTARAFAPPAAVAEPEA